MGRKPRAVELAIDESSKNYLQWTGDYLTWKEFLSHWDIYHASISHTLLAEAKEDAILFAHYLPAPWKPIMQAHIWNDNWTYSNVRSFMDSQITPYIPNHLRKSDW